jgi:DNA-binding transcriptional LysR family regulator
MYNDSGTLQTLAVFVEVARTGSFSRAGQRLRLSTATLSRSVAALEKDCGVRLLDRSTRRVEPTQAGRSFLDRCGPIVDEARRAREDLREQVRHVAGSLRVSMPADFGALIAAPMLAAFTQAHPAVGLQLDLSPQHQDLRRDDVDLAIRLGSVKGDALVVRRIGWLTQAPFASPRYLRHHGTPQHPSELSRHACIVTSAQRAAWAFSAGGTTVKVAVSSRFAANNQTLMSALARADMGIALLETGLAAGAVRAGQLVRVLPGWSAPRLAVQAVTASRLESALVKAFVKLLREFLQNAAPPTPP